MDFHITYILNNKSLDEIWIKIVLGGPRNGEECEADTFVPDSSCEQVHVVVVLTVAGVRYYPNQIYSEKK